MQQREYPVTMSSNKWMHERQSSVTHRVPCCSVPVTNCPSLLQSTEDGQRASSQSPVLWLLRGAACHHGAGRALMSDAQNKLQRHTVNACPRNKKQIQEMTPCSSCPRHETFLQAQGLLYITNITSHAIFNSWICTERVEWHDRCCGGASALWLFKSN